MGRELKRKQAKREGKNVKELQVKKQDFNTMKPKTLVIIVAVILVLFIVLYLLTSIFVTKDFGTNKKNNRIFTSSRSYRRRIKRVARMDK